MVTVNPTTWGPAFWEKNYGLSTFEEFYEVAGPLVEGFRVGPFGPPTEATSRLAWFNPASGPGVYLSARFKIDPPTTDDPGVNLFDLLMRQALAAGQENDVPTLTIPNAFQVSIESTAGGQQFFNVVGVTNSGGTAAGAAAAVKAAWEGVGRPTSQLSSSITMVNYRAVDLSSEFGEIADLASSTAGSGTAGNGFATLAASALVQWNGSTRSRSTRGRLYFGPIRESDINSDGRTIVAGTLANFRTAFEGFRSSLATAGYPLAVLSRKNLVAYPVSSSTVESVVATQRRRLR